jgi:hypothetical protein
MIPLSVPCQFDPVNVYNCTISSARGRERVGSCLSTKTIILFKMIFRWLRCLSSLKSLTLFFFCIHFRDHGIRGIFYGINISFRCFSFFLLYIFGIKLDWDFAVFFYSKNYQRFRIILEFYRKLNKKNDLNFALPNCQVLRFLPICLGFGRAVTFTGAGGTGCVQNEDRRSKTLKRRPPKKCQQMTKIESNYDRKLKLRRRRKIRVN